MASATAQSSDFQPSDRYGYRLDGVGPFPDPASRYQPEGVHGPSQIVDAGSFAWDDRSWHGIPRSDLVIYELHVGTFSPEGTFAGAADRLPDLARLGITRDRADAGRRLPRPAELGVRRGGPLRPGAMLRSPG